MFIQRLRKYSKPLICISGLVLLVVGTHVFADSPAATAKLDDAQILDQIIELMSRGWIILATIAGKLMTNTFVYGQFLNFDVYLRGMWNIAKVFANLTIGFFFFGWVRDLVFEPGKMTGSEVGKTIGGWLLAGILIQASWFLVGAVLDVETITTAAAGSLPALVIQENSDRGQYIIESSRASGIVDSKLELKKKSDINGSLTIARTTGYIVPANTNESILDAILPSYNTMSGPLYFIGFFILKFQDYEKIPLNTLNNIQDLSQILSATTIKVLVQFAFIIFMFLFVLINVVRIGYLWMVIALSPLLFLLIVMQGIIGIDILKKLEEGIGMKFDVATILAYIFQPTIVVAYMSIMLIAVVALRHGLDSGPITIQDYSGLTITDTGATHAAFEFSSKGDMFDGFAENGRGIFKNLVMIGLIFALLIGMIVLSAKSMKVKFIENIATSLGKAITNIPMIPIATMQTFGQNELSKAGINIGAGNVKMDSKAANEFREFLGLTPEVSATDNNELRKNITNPVNFFAKAQELRDKRKGKGFSLESESTFANNLVSLINNVKGDTRYGFTNFDIDELKDKEGNKFQGDKIDIAQLKNYLSNEKNHQALYQWMYEGTYTPGKTMTKPVGSTEFDNKDNIMKEKFIKNETP